MGLLDDAIREHLELKRRHGGDPAVIAHQERAALEPVFPDEAGEGDGAQTLGEHDADAIFEEPPPQQANGEAAREAAEDHGAEPEPHRAEDALADFSQTGQETAELDMSAVLDEAEQDAHVPGEIVAAPPRQRDEHAAAAEEGFEWQSPGPEGEQSPGDVPGQERLSFE